MSDLPGRRRPAVTMAGEGAGVQLPGGGCWFTAAAAGDYSDPGVAQLEELAASLGLGGRVFSRSTQVHGSRVRLVAGRQEARDGEGFDGQLTTSDEVIGAVRTADCLPVALFSPEAAGVLHAGWRGLAGGVVASGMEAMASAGGGPVTAVIGPGARSCCYEAGEEVHAAFTGLGAQARSGRNADLPWIAGQQLTAHGAAEVIDCGICTICSQDPRWHSHRRDGREAGRSLALAWLS